MKFLVTGAAGLVGSQIVKDLSKSDSHTYSCYHSSKPRFGIPTQIDLTNSENIIKTIDTIKPDVIIHLAAMTDVDLCEKQKELALLINSKSTETLSKQAAKQRAFFVYVSTDYVFDGESGLKKETDIPNPTGYYGRSKLEGEKAVMDLASSWCIARTSTPFGIHDTKKSFPLFVVENLQKKKEISAVIDQYTSPTYVPNLSKMILEISTRQINGVIHLAGATRISRYGVASMVAEKLNLEKKLIKQKSTSEMNWVAKRPKDSSLNVSKASLILQEKPISIEQGLDFFIQEIKPKLR